MYENDLLSYEDRFEQYFYFFDSLTKPILPTSVFINNNLAAHPRQGFCNMPLNGDDFTWTVLGNLNIPSFTDTVSSISEIAVNYPTPDTTILHKSNGITINHGVFTNADHYYIRIEDDLYTSKLYLDSTISTNVETKIRYFVNNNSGSTTITPSMLTDFSSNRYLRIFLIAYKEDNSIHSNKKVKFLTGSAVMLKYELQN